MSGRPRLIRLKAWLVSGTPARGTAFAIDFVAALGQVTAIALRGLTRRLKGGIL